MKKILIADSLKPLLLSGNTFLSRADISVITAATNDEVLAKHIEEKADLIITTFGLPGLSCETLCSTIRLSRDLRTVSILIICPDTPGYRERGARCGANAVMVLPVGSVKLADKIKELLDISPRRSYRVILNVVVEGTRKNRPFLCSSENVSATGMLIKSEDPLTVGDRVACSFYLPGGSKVHINGKVARAVGPDPGSKAAFYGVQFTDMAPDSKSALDNFIEQEIRKQLPPGTDTLVA